MSGKILCSSFFLPPAHLRKGVSEFLSALPFLVRFQLALLGYTACLMYAYFMLMLALYQYGQEKAILAAYVFANEKLG